MSKSMSNGTGLIVVGPKTGNKEGWQAVEGASREIAFVLGHLHYSSADMYADILEGAV